MHSLLHVRHDTMRPFLHPCRLPQRTPFLPRSGWHFSCAFECVVCVCACVLFVPCFSFFMLLPRFALFAAASGGVRVHVYACRSSWVKTHVPLSLSLSLPSLIAFPPVSPPLVIYVTCFRCSQFCFVSFVLLHPLRRLPSLYKPLRVCVCACVCPLYFCVCVGLYGF